MRICFDRMDELVIPHLGGGPGETAANMHRDSSCKIMLSRLPAGAFPSPGAAGCALFAGVPARRWGSGCGASRFP